MAKLFIFAIGGSGSRVVKALTMLLAAGVELPHTDTIVPIIIDPDSANGDLTRTEEILQLYKKIHQQGYTDQTTFFKTKISSLDELGEGGFVSDNFKFDIEGIKEHLFKEFIGYSEMDKNNQAMTSMLFSRSNLDADMDVGFKGNPNIGSVVLNKFSTSDFFRKFAEAFGQDDRVFIISSIFGGTGASGFPLILKNIRNAAPPLANHVSLNNARIGAVTLLPYYNINGLGTKTEIDSNVFITKTKAALSYYAKNISGSSSLNALYYIGDKLFTDHRINGADGAAEQKNKAHFIEMAAALSIASFMETGDIEMQTEDGKVPQPRYYEFGLKEETNEIQFRHLAKATYDTIAQPLTQYALFDLFLKHHFKEKEKQKFATNGNNKLQEQSLNRVFLHDLELFNTHFEQWLEEMGNSMVSFAPLNMHVQGKDIINLVNGNPEKSGGIFSFMKDSGIDYYVATLNKTEEKKEYDALGNSNKKLMAVFSNATATIVKERINL